MRRFPIRPSPSKAVNEANVRDIELPYYSNTSLTLFLLYGNSSVTSRKSVRGMGTALRGVIGKIRIAGFVGRVTNFSKTKLILYIRMPILGYTKQNRPLPYPLWIQFCKGVPTDIRTSESLAKFTSPILRSTDYILQSEPGYPWIWAKLWYPYIHS